MLTYGEFNRQPQVRMGGSEEQRNQGRLRHLHAKVVMGVWGLRPLLVPGTDATYPQQLSEEGRKSIRVLGEREPTSEGR